MARRRIAIDCDDVIVPTAGLIIANYNKTYGTQLRLADLYSNDLKVWGVSTRTVAIERVNAYLITEEYQRVEPLRDAISTVQVLAQHHDLHIVTGRADFLSEATEAMLTRYFPGIFQSIEFTNFYGKTSRTKAEVCEALGADLLIDDHMHHAEVVAECGIEVLLFGSYPWNEGKLALPTIRRVKDWAEILTLLVPKY